MVIEPRRLLTVHLVIIAGLVLANVPIAVMDGMGHYSLYGYSRLLRLEEEANIPSFFSSLALIACAVAAFANRSRLPPGDPDRSAWGLLAAFFAFLALDEAAMLHELANRISADLDLDGTLTNLGVFVYVPITIWLAARLLRFWLRQERRLRAALLAGAAMYGAAAFGVELVENELLSAGFGPHDLPLRVSFTFEESGEMLAVAVFLYAFLRHFSRMGGGPLIALTVRDEREKLDEQGRRDSRG